MTKAKKRKSGGITWSATYYIGYAAKTKLYYSYGYSHGDPSKTLKGATLYKTRAACANAIRWQERSDPTFVETYGKFLVFEVRAFVIGDSTDPDSP